MAREPDTKTRLIMKGNPKESKMTQEKAKVKVSHIPECSGCGEPIQIGDPAYAVQSGYIDEMGDFVRTDCQSQLFHIGRCLNTSE